MSGLAFDDIRRVQARKRGIREHADYERAVSMYYSEEQLLESDRFRRKRNRLIAAMCFFGLLAVVFVSAGLLL